MSLYALWMRRPDPSVAQIEKAVQGNLCRCTGYAPIVRAAQAAASADPSGDVLLAERGRVTERLAALRDGARVEVGEGCDRAILPRDADDLAAVLAEHPEATIVAGATDVGLWVTKFLRRIGPAVFIDHIEGLRRIEEGADGLRIGACVSYSDAYPAIAARHPELVELWDRIGGEQVRNMGTIGGNVANGSPIGDTPPVLIALDARVRLRSAEGRREMALEDFFIDYGRQDRRPGEFVEEVFVPSAAGGCGRGGLQGHQAPRRGHHRGARGLPAGARGRPRGRHPHRLWRDGRDAEARSGGRGGAEGAGPGAPRARARR